MKIVLLCNAAPPEIDGVGDYTFQLAQAMAAAGVSIEIICRRQNHVTPPPGIPVYALIRRWNRQDRQEVLLQLQQSRPDWVGIQYVPYGFDPWGVPEFLPGLVRQIRRAGIQVFVMFHEVSVRMHNLQSLLIGCRQKRIARRLCRLAGALFTSIPLYVGLLGRFESRVRVVPIGANVYGRQLAEPERLALRRRLAPDSDCLICTFGNREPGLLLEALRRLVPAIPTLRLLVPGHNSREAEYREAQFVDALGPLPPEEISAILQAADLYILPDPVSPGGHGGTSNKSGALAAACAAGQAIIGVKGNLNNDLLRHGQNIFLSDGRDPGAFAEAVKTLMDAPELRAQLKQNSRALYEKHLRWEVIAQAYLETLSQK